MDYKEFFKQKRSLIITIVVLISISLIGGIVLALQIEKKIEAEANKVWRTHKIEEKEKTYIDEVVESKDIKKYYNNGLDISEIKVSNEEDIYNGDTLFVIKDKDIEDEVKILKDKLSELENKKLTIDKDEEKDELKSIEKQISTTKKDITNLEKKIYEDIKSPISGRVYLNEAVSINEGDMILSIESDELCIKTEVSENDVVNINVGEEVTVRINALDAYIGGKIANISNKSIRCDDKKKLSYYEVIIEFETEEDDENLDKLKDGFHAQIAFDIHDTIKIPISAVVKEDKKSYVFISDEGVLTKRPIKIVKEDEKFVYIEQGVELEDIIIKYPDSTLKDGKQVKTDEIKDNKEDESNTNENNTNE